MRARVGCCSLPAPATSPSVRSWLRRPLRRRRFAHRCSRAAPPRAWGRSAPPPCGSGHRSSLALADGARGAGGAAAAAPEATARRHLPLHLGHSARVPPLANRPRPRRCPRPLARAPCTSVQRCRVGSLRCLFEVAIVGLRPTRRRSARRAQRAVAHSFPSRAGPHLLGAAVDVAYRRVRVGPLLQLANEVILIDCASIVARNRRRHEVLPPLVARPTSAKWLRAYLSLQ